jgi:hypothetical protein
MEPPAEKICAAPIAVLSSVLRFPQGNCQPSHDDGDRRFRDGFTETPLQQLHMQSQEAS